MVISRAVSLVFVWVTFGLGVWPASFAAVPNVKIRAAITACNDSFVAAVSRGSGAAAAELYSEGAQLLPPNHAIVNGRPGIQGFWQSAFDSGVKAAKLETLELGGHGDWVYEVGNYILFGATGADLDNGKYVVIWVQEKGSWRLHRDIWNSSRNVAGS